MVCVLLAGSSPAGGWAGDVCRRKFCHLCCEEKVREAREMFWGCRLTSHSLSSAAFWSSVFHGNPASSSNTAVNPCLIPPPSHLSGKLMMQLGMLTKCICAGEQWLMKVKTFCGKGLGFFLILKRAFYIAYSSWTTEENQLQRRTQGFAGFWWGGNPEPGLLLFFAWYDTRFVQRTTDPTEKACWDRHSLTLPWGMKRNIWHLDIFHNVEFFSPSRSFSRWWREISQHDCSLLVISRFSAWLIL